MDHEPLEFGGHLFGAIIRGRLVAFTLSGDTFLFGIMLIGGGFHLHIGPFGLLVAREA